MKDSYKKANKAKLQPYDMMLYMNVFMALVALAVAVSMDQFFSGIAFVKANPDLALMVLKFALCSAIGQSFIFFTIANFDPLVCSTVTTTRKIFSVLLSIFYYGHSVRGVKRGVWYRLIGNTKRTDESVFTGLVSRCATLASCRNCLAD